MLNEAYHYAKPSSFSRGLAAGFGRIGDSAHFRDGERGAERRDTARGRFPRPDTPHVPEHYGSAWRRKARPGKTSCAPRATCATSIGITPRSMRSGRPSTSQRDSIRCRRRRAFRRSFAVRTCWSRSKPSLCFATGRGVIDARAVGNRARAGSPGGRKGAPALAAPIRQGRR